MKLIYSKMGLEPVRLSIEGEEISDTEGGAPVDTSPDAAPGDDGMEGTPETDFEALATELESDDVEPEPEQPTEPAPAEPPAEPEQPEQPVEAAEPTPAEPAQPVAEPAPAEPAQEPLTPEAIEAAYTQYRDQIMPQLEQQYQLSQEQVDALNDNPAEVIPKIAAQIHYQAQIAAYTGIMSQLPQIVSSVLDRHTAIQEAQGRFYSRWPDLQKSEYADKVDSTLQAWRNANPNASGEEMIEKAGLMAMLALGLDPTPQAEPEQPTNGGQPPARPAAPAGAGAPRTPEAGASNIWESMADEIEQDGI